MRRICAGHFNGVVAIAIDKPVFMVWHGLEIARFYTSVLIYGMETVAYPLRFDPVYKDYLWGGSRIPQVFGRSGTPTICAESWEIADRPEGMSIVRNGCFTGKSLRMLMETHASDILGGNTHAAVFPLLIKLIDARDRLSVQVHPDDAGARRFGGEAKTEMWYVLDAAPDAFVFAGLKPGVDRQCFRQAVTNGDCETLLHRLPVRAGQAIFIPGGRLHAIGEGCLLLEVQQNSNTTYRVYDWGRVDNQGRPRELHIEQAMQVIDWQDHTPHLITPPTPPFAASGATLTRNEFEILSCPYFQFVRLDLAAAYERRTARRTFDTWFVAQGTVAIETATDREILPTGSTCLVPAAVEHYRLFPTNGNASLLRISRP